MAGARGVAKLIIVLTTITAAIMELLDTSIVNVALFNMSGSLGVNIEDVAWVITSYAIATVIIIPLTGFLGEYFGRKNYYIVSMILFTVASYMCGASTSLGMLVFWRFVQGIGGGALLSTSQAILFDAFDPKDRAIASGIFGMGIVLGPTLGPTVGGYIMEHLNWRWIFYVNIPVGILATILAINFVPKREGEGGSVGRKKEDVPARVKDLYRVLVRRLHPDTGKSRNDPSIQRLWHDLQNAYAAQDVERLEVLLAMTDLHESGSAVRSTLFHLRKVAKEMENAVRELKARFREARTSPAWAFWHSDNREKAGAKIRAATEARIREAKNHITILESEINLWKQDARQPTKRGPGSMNHKAKKTSPPIFGDTEPTPHSTPPHKQGGTSKDQGFFDF